MASFIIYSEQGITARLRYVLDWIFLEQLSVPFEITDDKASFLASDQVKISYSTENAASDAVHIPASPLLFASGIDQQHLTIHRWKKTTILFYNQPGAEIPFDLFAAVFYLISRYEEYLPFRADRHQRFPAAQSLAATYRFLKDPVIDQWLLHFRKILSERYPVRFTPPRFSVRHTFDIDLAWKYRHKGTARTRGGYARDLLRGRWREVHERYQVLAGKQPDPYDNFASLAALHRRYAVCPLFFILLGSPGSFDKNAAPGAPPMQQLMKQLGSEYPLGIHPSYASNGAIEQLRQEIRLLATATGKAVHKSRQHYIKLTFPETYRNLIACGINEDYTMGYPEQNGFRAGTSQSFYWYDLKAEKVTDLKIHPFVFMDATSLFYLNQTETATWKEWIHFYHIIQNTQGQFTSIWHNFILQREETGQGWINLYKKALSTSTETSFDIP